MADATGEWTLAIDFGTTNTAAAACPMGDPGRARAIKLAAASTEMPSGVLADGERLLTGEVARNTAPTRPAEAHEPTPKRRIGEHRIVLGERTVAVVDVVAAVLDAVAQRAGRQFGDTAPTQLRLTHPAGWASWRKQLLADAARAAGLPSPALVAEPVAAATYYAAEHRDLPSGEPIAVYDLGGGTFDIAILRPTAESYEILATDMVDPLGGELFDLRLTEMVRDALQERGMAALSNRFDGAENLGWRRTLLEEIRRAKHVLSEEPTADIAVQAGEDSAVVSVTRDEFNRRIAGDLAQSIAATRRALDAAGVSASQLGRLYLVGGSSFLPLVHDLLTRELGIRPATFDDPKTVTAIGALHAPAAADVSAGPPAPPLQETAPGSAFEARAPHAPQPVAAPAPQTPQPAAAPAPYTPQPAAAPGRMTGGPSWIRPAAYSAAGLVALALVAAALGGLSGGDREREAAGSSSTGDVETLPTTPEAQLPPGNTQESEPPPAPESTPTSAPEPDPEPTLPELDEFFVVIPSAESCSDTTEGWDFDAYQVIGCDFDGFIVDFHAWRDTETMWQFVDDQYAARVESIEHESDWDLDGSVAGGYYIWAVEGGYELLWTVDNLLMTGHLYAPVGSAREAEELFFTRSEFQMDGSYLQ